MEEREIYGYKVIYEKRAERAVDYLKNDLSREEANVFFDYAKRKGKAQFEDDDDRQFTLIFQKGIYILKRRD